MSERTGPFRASNVSSAPRNTRAGGIHATVELLRLATAGSVDDGKSTLVGRILYDTQSILGDQLEAITRASTQRGLAEPDLALLVDGLRAEREQGITIDVAYRYFATPGRSFVLADTPGHVQYTRNTVSGASTAQLVVLLVDARKGIVAQTRRHAAILSLLGVPRLVLAVNKVDLVDDPAAVFDGIAGEFTTLAARLGWTEECVTAIPISALHGDNVAMRSDRTPYYDGPSLLEHLETVPVDDTCAIDTPIGLRFPVQYVIRPRNADFPDYRGYAGRVATGTVRPGDEVVVLPAGMRTTVTRVDTADGPREAALAGDSITLILDDDIDISRGDMIVAASDRPDPLTRFDATVCWLHDKPLRTGGRMLLKYGAKTVAAIVRGIDERLDEQRLAAIENPESVHLNDIARITVETSEPIYADHYSVDRSTGCFLLIDPPTGDTLAAGLVGNALSGIEIGTDGA